MATTSDCSISKLVRTASNLSLPRLSSNDIEHLVQYSVVPETEKIGNSQIPLINPYHVYKRKPMSIKTLISTPRPDIKEYVQSSKMDSCNVQFSKDEQYISLNIPTEFINSWKVSGYTHLHFGAIRIALTYHGRKALPVTARLALLDSRHLQCENAVIGTVVTTLNAGSVMFTFFPNFNVSLKDPHLSSALKIQIQLFGADLLPGSIMATLHRQIVYRLQNHALDLRKYRSSDALLVLADSEEEIPTVVQVPRQLSREKLKTLMPQEWITNYEGIFQQSPLQSTQASFYRLADGKVKTKFAEPEANEGPSSLFTQMMISLAEDQPDPKIPVHSFRSDGTPIYVDKIDGHFIWDVNPSECDPDCTCHLDYDSEEDEEFLAEKRKKLERLQRRKARKETCKQESLFFSQTPPPPPSAPCLTESCLMFNRLDDDFPPLERKVDTSRQLFSKPYIIPAINHNGAVSPLSRARKF